MEKDGQAARMVCLLIEPWNIRTEDILRELKFKRGNQWIGNKRVIRITRLWIHGIGFTGFREGVEKDGHAAKMVCSPENLKGTQTQWKASTPPTATPIESGKYWIFLCPSLIRRSQSELP